MVKLNKSRPLSMKICLQDLTFRKFACPFKLQALLQRLPNREHKPDRIGICCVGYCAEDENGENPKEKPSGQG